MNKWLDFSAGLLTGFGFVFGLLTSIIGLVAHLPAWPWLVVMACSYVSGTFGLYLHNRVKERKHE